MLSRVRHGLRTRACVEIEALDKLSRLRVLSLPESLRLESLIEQQDALETWAQRRRVAIADIQALVCKRFSVAPIEMQSDRRSRRVARPRQVAMYLARELTTHSMPAIGRFFGRRDHTTVLYACRQVETLRAADPDIDAAVRDLTEQLSSRREGFAQAQGA